MAKGILMLILPFNCYCNCFW